MEESLKNKKELSALYSKKAEEARISGAMDQEDLVNVKVTDRAQVPLAPLASSAALLLTLAAIVGVGASVGGVLTLEYVRPTFHSELDVERHLQLPVLALIPDLREEA
jgi:capsular polysaccharide biosynthesis protein